MAACQPTDSITCQRVNPSVRSNAMSRRCCPSPLTSTWASTAADMSAMSDAKERRNVIDLTEVEELALGVDEPGPEQLRMRSEHRPECVSQLSIIHIRGTSDEDTLCEREVVQPGDPVQRHRGSAAEVGAGRNDAGSHDSHSCRGLVPRLVPGPGLADGVDPVADPEVERVERLRSEQDLAGFAAACDRG